MMNCMYSRKDRDKKRVHIKNNKYMVVHGLWMHFPKQRPTEIWVEYIEPAKISTFNSLPWVRHGIINKQINFRQRNYEWTFRYHLKPIRSARRTLSDIEFSFASFSVDFGSTDLFATKIPTFGLRKENLLTFKIK